MTTRLPYDTCPYCNHRLDAVSGVTEKGGDDPGKPDPGSLSVCISCAQVLIFDDTMKLRKPAHNELKRIYREDPKAARVLRVVQKGIRAIHGGDQ